jgi:hypothetical protein
VRRERDKGARMSWLQVRTSTLRGVCVSLFVLCIVVFSVLEGTNAVSFLNT